MRGPVGRILWCFGIALVLLPLRPRNVVGQRSSDSLRVERLTSLGGLWATLKYVHPYLSSSRIDWDSALVATVPRVRAAQSSGSFRAAVQGMLDALKDPATRVVDEGSPARANPADPDPHGRRLDGNIWLLSIHQYGDLQDFSTVERIQGQLDSIAAARAVIIDLRTDATGDDPTAMSLLAYSGIDRALESRPLTAPAQRGRYQSGFVPSAGDNPGYTAGFYMEAGARIEPGAKGPAKPVVFIVNRLSLIPPVALALQDAGLGWIVGEGAISDAPAVGTMLLSLCDSVRVAVRTTELIHSDGSVGFSPDTVVQSSPGSDPALQAALALTRTAPARRKHTIPPPAFEGTPPDRPYAEPVYPNTAHRLLGAYRMWAVMEFFYPYRDLTGENPTEVLRAFVPRLEEAGDSLEYALTVAEMWTHIHDSHGFISGPALNAYWGTARPPVRLRSIEGQPVVTDLSPGCGRSSRPPVDEAQASQSLRSGDQPQRDAPDSGPYPRGSIGLPEQQLAGDPSIE
jgi:hypothetical protein